MIEKILAVNRMRLGLDAADVARDTMTSREFGAENRLCILRYDNATQLIVGTSIPVHTSGYIGEDGSLTWSTQGGPNAATLIESPSMSAQWPMLDLHYKDRMMRLLTVVSTGTEKRAANVYAVTDASRTQLLMLDGMNVHDDGEISF